MLPLSLVLVLTSALAADLPPRELIGRLGSPDRVVREEAARTLEERGAEALPALRAALEAAREPEARERFADLIARAEARSLDRPTMVALDVDDRPLGEAVEALATRSGFALSLDDPTLAGRRVTVRAPGTLPFWEAVDRLGRAGHVRHDPGPPHDALGHDPRASTIRLVAGHPPALTAYSGPLRIHLFAAHRHRDLDFEADGASRDPRRSATVTVEVQAFAEPGRSLNPNGLPRLEAVDEWGRAISPQSVGGGEQPERGGNSWLIPGRISLLHWHVPLGLPDPPVRSPLKLRGVLPVVISSRRLDPLVIPLVGAAGKTFRQGPRVVRIEKVSGQGPRTTAVNLSLSEDVIPADRTRVSAGPETDYIGDFLPDRIEFDDAEGHPLSWLLLGAPSVSTTNDEIRVRTFVSGVAPPARLSVYRLHRLATEIPFEFGEVPSP
ncbi:MAG: hypothetical protein ACHRXM_21065 [Isosphaerales bacterium]